MISFQNSSFGFRELHWKFPALLKNVERVCQLVEQELNNHHLHKKDRFAITLLVREALNNAVLHGCLQNPELTFSCKLVFSIDEVMIEVIDDGAGFNWRTRIAQANCEPPEETDENGRGFPIFKLYANSTSFNEAGNCIRLTRKIT